MHKKMEEKKTRNSTYRYTTLNNLPMSKERKMICCIIYKEQTWQKHSVITVYSWSGLWSNFFFLYFLQTSNDDKELLV